MSIPSRTHFDNFTSTSAITEFLRIAISLHGTSSSKDHRNVHITYPIIVIKPMKPLAPDINKLAMWETSAPST